MTQEYGSIRRYWLTATSAVWLCMLPILLWKYSLPELLRRATAAGNRCKRENLQELDSTLGLLKRLCQLRLFRLPPFPRDCMRQSLVLYRALTRMGYPVVIHFGVRKEGSRFEGHSWVTVNSRLVEEPDPFSAFTRVYSYPVPSKEWTQLP